MKNNTLAMFATISLVLSLGLLISYIDPAVCAGSQIADLSMCTQAASAHIWSAVCCFAFGVITLVGGTVRSNRKLRRERIESALLQAREQKSL